MNKWWSVMVAILGVFIVGFITVFYWQSSRNDLAVLGITNTIQNVVVSNMDRSSRTETEYVRFDLNNLDQKFIEEFPKTSSLNLDYDKIKYEFRYLVNVNGQDTVCISTHNMDPVDSPYPTLNAILSSAHNKEKIFMKAVRVKIYTGFADYQATVVVDVTHDKTNP